MLKWLREFDSLLRGEATRPEALRRGQIEVPAGGLCLALVVLGVIAGACVGSFALIRDLAGEEYLGNGWMQFVASAVKLPLLFLLTLLVTFPSLYVFNALVGSRLSAESVLRLLIATVAVMLAVFASLGPIIVFFGLSTTSYPFMVVLNVVAATVSGVLGLAFLLRTLDRLVVVLQGRRRDEAEIPEAQAVEVLEGPPVAPRPEAPGALDRQDVQTTIQARRVFRIWVVVFALVGAQMSWVLRPFVGTPEMPFEWVRPRGEKNFFLAVIESLARLLGG